MKDYQWKKRAVIAAVSCTTLLYAGSYPVEAAGPDGDAMLDQVVVTATRMPTTEFNANANINVITQADIEKNHYQDLSEALRNVPGVTISNYGGGVGYENSNAVRINGSDQVLVLINGIRVNQAGVKFPASAYRNLGNVERIEVLKGSASALYGSDAKGGVINIITKKVEEEQTRLNVGGGSNDKLSYGITKEGVDGNWNYRLSWQKDKLGDYKDGKGDTYHQDLDADSVDFSITNQIKDNSDVTLYYNSYTAKYEYMDLFPYSGKTSTRYGTANNYDLGLIVNYEIDENTHNRFSLSRNLYDTEYNQYLTQVRTFILQDQFSKKLGDAHLVVAGFDYTEDKAISNGEVKLTNRALYLQDEWDMTEQWKLTTGLRYDNNSAFGSKYTPRVNLGYQADDRTNYYVSHSRFFITPTPYQLFNAAYGNPELDPETGYTNEFGVNHRIDDTLSLSMHLFQRESKDVVGFAYSADKPNGTYINVEDEKAKGWDIQLNKKFSDTLSGFVGYTYTHIDGTPARSDNVDGYIPKGAWNVGLDYKKDKFGASLLGRGVIDRPGPQSVDVYDGFFPCESYWVWDIGINYKMSDTSKAFIKINNIFDKFYAEHSNARGNRGGAPEQWWTSQGRNVFAGVEYSF